MNWWRALLVLAGGACVLFACSTLQDPWVTTPRQRAVAIATLPCATANQANSSGFVVDDRTVVTVAHAIFESRDVAVRDAFGRWHRPDIVQLDLERDVAVLHIEDLRATPLPVAPRRPTADWAGLPVTLIDGAASGTLDAELVRRVRLRTEVVGNRDEQSLRSGYEVLLDIAPGDSGGALLDDDGALVAMVFARSTRRPDVSWATAADQIDVGPGPVATWPCNPPFEAELELREPGEARLP